MPFVSKKKDAFRKKRAGGQSERTALPYAAVRHANTHIYLFLLSARRHKGQFAHENEIFKIKGYKKRYKQLEQEKVTFFRENFGQQNTERFDALPIRFNTERSTRIPSKNKSANFINPLIPISRSSESFTSVLTSEAVVLMEGSTGQILYEKEATKKLRPASITKVMTLLLIFEAIEDGRKKNCFFTQPKKIVFIKPFKTKTLSFYV